MFKWRNHQTNWKNKPSSEVLAEAESKHAFFWQFFVSRADGYINCNINGDLGVVNGAPVNCHSLAFKSKRMVQTIMSKTANLPWGSVIELGQPPDAVNVTIKPMLDDKPPTKNCV